MLSVTRHVLVLALALLTGMTPARAADWPEFRGPTRQGHADAKNVPTEWNATKNIAWKVPLAGEGWSSPVVVKDRIYLSMAVPTPEAMPMGYSLVAAALDLKTGETKWMQKLFEEDSSKAPKIHSKNSHASATPIVEGDRLYVHFGHMGTACLDLAGNVLWRSNEVVYEPVHGNGGSPAIVGNALIFSVDGMAEPRVVALDKRTGKGLWATPRAGKPPKTFAFCTPLAIEVGGKTQVILPGAGMVGAYDPATGEEIWRVMHEGYSVIPRPVFVHGLVYISTSYDSPTAMAIRPDGSGDVTETHVAWTYKKAAPHTPSLLVVEDLIYMVSDRGVAACLDAKTGEEIWQKRLGGNYSASPVYAGGHIYMLDENGSCHVLAPGRKFTEVAENTLPERTLASLAVIDGAILLRGDKFLYRIEKGAE